MSKYTIHGPNCRFENLSGLLGAIEHALSFITKEPERAEIHVTKDNGDVVKWIIEKTQ